LLISCVRGGPRRSKARTRVCKLSATFWSIYARAAAQDGTDVRNVCASNRCVQGR